MTKESKLARARRLIPEWQVYDKEIENLRISLKIDPPEVNNNEHQEL
jgi:hypothetical protein